MAATFDRKLLNTRFGQVHYWMIGSGPWLFYERPEAIASAVTEFLSQDVVEA